MTAFAASRWWRTRPCILRQRAGWTSQGRSCGRSAKIGLTLSKGSIARSAPTGRFCVSTLRTSRKRGVVPSLRHPLHASVARNQRFAGHADQFQEPGKRAVPVRLGSGSGSVGDLRRRPRWSGGSHSRANRNARARRSGEIPRLDTGSNDHGDRRQQPAAAPGAGTTA